jgi:deoxyadenosine/deoxycytidine kinase
MANLQVALAGNIGAGKSGLCTALAEQVGARADLEDVDTNPYFDAFYADPSRWAFSSQLAFAAEAAARHIRAQDGLPVIMDRTIHESVGVFGRMLAARGELDQDQMDLLDRIVGAVTDLPRQPQALIHLTAPIDVLLDRIDRRHRPAEVNIGPSYLEELQDRYTEFVAAWDLSPVVTVDTSTRDLRRQEEIEALVGELECFL